MTERGIPFSGPMVRAVLAGRKTQTRRAIAGPIEYLGPRGAEADPKNWGWAYDGKHGGGYMVVARGVNNPCGNNQDTHSIPCPYGAPGDRLWVREAWRAYQEWDARSPAEFEVEPSDIDYDATPTIAPDWGRYRHARFMPRWVSRLTLEVVSVRVERVQAITDADIAAEGVDAEAVRALWEGATGKARAATGFVHPSIMDYAKRKGLVGLTPIFDSVPPRDLWRIAWTLINGAESWDANPWVWAVEFRRTP